MYKNGTLAFDSKISADCRHVGSVTKGRKTNKYLCAGCGSVEDLIAVLDWVSDGGILQKRKEFGLDRECDVSALLISKKGSVFHIDSRVYPYLVDASFHACGSGSDLAIGAMAMGASAVEAVRVASKFDGYTGGSIRTLTWK